MRRNLCLLSCGSWSLLTSPTFFIWLILTAGYPAHCWLIPCPLGGTQYLLLSYFLTCALFLLRFHHCMQTLNWRRTIETSHAMATHLNEKLSSKLLGETTCGKSKSLSDLLGMIPKAVFRSQRVSAEEIAHAHQLSSTPKIAKSSKQFNFTYRCTTITALQWWVLPG